MKINNNDIALENADINNSYSTRYDNIEYNDQWESVPVARAEPIHIDPDDEDFYQENEDYQEPINEKSKRKIKEKSSPQPVLKMQILLAILLLATAFILKFLGGEVYTTAKEWYFTNLNNSLVASLLSDVEIPTNTNVTDNSI